MRKAESTENRIIVDIWKSFRSIPGWVQIWVFFFLVPINMASLIFIDKPLGLWIAFLANIGMMPNLLVMWVHRGISNAMALPHLVPWTILVVILLFARPMAEGAYDVYLWVLLVTNAISLAFDYLDSVKWLRGEREVAGR